MTPRSHRWLRAAGTAAGIYVTVAFLLATVANLIVFLRAGHTTGLSFAGVLLLPLGMVTHPLDPVSAFGEHAGDLKLPMYALGFLALLLTIWVGLGRHDILNPLTLNRDPQSLPIERRLRPRLRDIGVWRAHDATRGDSRAAFIDKVKVFFSRVIPGVDPARTAYRLNGMLVPWNAPQPAARIYLGTINQVMWLRRKKFNVYARPEQHVLVYGPSGAGKGAGQMNPSLLMWNGDTDGSLDGHGKGWPGPLITSTVKNDHVDVSLEWRLSLSDQCFIYDPMQLFPEYSQYWVGWDPLSQIRSFADANRVASALMESEQQQGGGGSGNEEYFRAQALMVLAPLLLSAALAGKPFRTVYEWSLGLDSEASNPDVVAQDGEVDPSSMMYQALDPLYEYQEKTGDGTPLNQLNQVFAKAEQEASGVWGSVRKSLQPYNDEKSVQSTSATTMNRILDPEVFFTTPHATLYVIAPQVATESKRMRPVFAAFLTWLVEQAQEVAGRNNGKLPYPVLANLDEVKNVGALPGLAHTLSLTRSIGFFVKHAWQDDAQIESAYGKDDAKTITSNSRTWVILPGMSDSGHLDQLANLLGERKVRVLKLGKNKANSGADRVRAGSASMIKELRDTQILIVTDNLPPFVIEANRYFLDKVMSSRFRLGDHRRATGQMPDPDSLRQPSAARPDDTADGGLPGAQEVHLPEVEEISAPTRKRRRGRVHEDQVPDSDAPSDFFLQMQSHLHGNSDQENGPP